jgi:hypothetical protein
MSGSLFDEGCTGYELGGRKQLYASGLFAQHYFQRRWIPRTVAEMRAGADLAVDQISENAMLARARVPV